MLFLASLPCYLDIGWRLTVTFKILAPHRTAQMRLLLVVISLWYAAFPLACQIAYRLRPTGLVNSLLNGHPASDFTLAYPCWLIVIVAGYNV